MTSIVTKQLIDLEKLNPTDYPTYGKSKNGDCVLLMEGSGKSMAITLETQKKIKINKINGIKVSALIGVPFGSIFELKGNKLELMDPSCWSYFDEHTIEQGEQQEEQQEEKQQEEQQNQEEQQQEQQQEQQEKEEQQPQEQKEKEKKKKKKSNKSSYDSNDIQKLTEKEILSMKSECGGEELVNKLASSSKTFHHKNPYSQAKYLKKKKAKYVHRFMMLECNSWNLLQFFFNEKPYQSLRQDAVSQILTLGNIFPNQHVLVFETFDGLLIGAIADRLNGYGKIFNCYNTLCPSIIVHKSMYSLNYAEKNIVYNFHINLLNTTNNNNNDYDPDVCDQEFIKPKLNDIKNYLLNDQVDSLIICANTINLVSVFWHLWKCLCNGGVFVVWSKYIEMVKILHNQLFRKSCAINLRLHDNWFREYQILPNRTHPCVGMNHSSGYILSGIKVDSYSDRSENDDGDYGSDNKNNPNDDITAVNNNGNNDNNDNNDNNNNNNDNNNNNNDNNANDDNNKNNNNNRINNDENITDNNNIQEYNTNQEMDIDDNTEVDDDGGPHTKKRRIN